MIYIVFTLVILSVKKYNMLINLKLKLGSLHLKCLFTYEVPKG